MALKTSPLAKFIRTDVRTYVYRLLFFILHSSTFFPCFIIAIGIDFTTAAVIKLNDQTVDDSCLIIRVSLKLKYQRPVWNGVKACR